MNSYSRMISCSVGRHLWGYTISHPRMFPSNVSIHLWGYMYHIREYLTWNVGIHLWGYMISLPRIFPSNIGKYLWVYIISHPRVFPGMSVYTYEATWYHIPKWSLGCRYTFTRLHDIISQNGPWKVSVRLSVYVITHPRNVLVISVYIYEVTCYHFPEWPLYCQDTSMSLHDITSQNDHCNVGIHLRDYMITHPRIGLGFHLWD
jgi:hypothetical protein